ncbi:hypothetical protein BO71DRAFT_312537 [Aspergillus ellipticus CBS 707.79]|uniref:CWF21 domain-containing protein n=1 Tax=Aspergillus ellipticus CBS 707.79 TaxID=1448320 RepID=A0A319F4W5_9EURO|nr:hypothetical protein BO71DRAFT_312537 [Aspergillus ellipticus CBS 707.79]
MSSNVGLTTPRGSGTSGYVQRNYAFMKPRTAGYGAPYPPVSGANSADAGRPFKQRQPDQQILEHDRRRAIEVKVMEERERLEEENERVEEEIADRNKNKKKKKKNGDEEEKEGEKEEGEGEGEGEGRILRQLKSYQVHELAEAKIEESERLRRALGIREDR